MAGSGLATVMFTDLVGSTRMRERLGDDVADGIGVEHDRIIGDALSSTGGRLVKSLGDGALAVFDSSVDAVVAGQRIQEGVLLYNRRASEDRQIGVRVGINAGEIATDNGDVIGLPVAVASRVCDKADGGQILITDTVRSLIGRRARFPYVSIGAHALKGVDGFVELWSVEDTAISDVSRARAEIPFPPFLARGMPTLLVGRDEQLSQLDIAYSEAATTVELVAIIGEPGIGKTSLTSTWCRTAADAGATIVAGRCTPDAALPYQPFVEIARAVLGQRPELLLDIGPAAGNIAQLVPGIEVPRDLPVPIQTDPETTKYLMAEAFAGLLESGEGAPASVVVLDDLHWADEHSIAVLTHIIRRDALSALVIGTYRDTDLVQDHPLPALLADLRREHRVGRITLQRLSEEDVAEMVSGHFGTAAPPDIVQSIADETQGNPFFVEEITTHLQDEGAIDASGRWVSDIPIPEYGIPEGLREVVGRRLQHLGQDAVSTLEIAAVMGPDFSIDVAGSIAGLDETSIDEVVETATSARVITEGDGADEFSFAHALLRQTLYDGLPIRRRMRIHRAVGEALESRGEAPAVLLNHWLRASENEKALECAVAAAESAQKVFAGSDALAHLEMALDIWDDVEDADQVAGVSHAQLVIQLSDVNYDFGEISTASVLRIRNELNQTDLDDTTRALLLNQLASDLWQTGHSIESADTLADALRVVPKSPPNAAHALILAAVAVKAAVEGMPTEAIENGQEALALAKSVEDQTAEGTALLGLGTALGFIGRTEEAGRYFDELSELGQNTGVLKFQLIGFVNHAEAIAQYGPLEDALQFTEEGIARASGLGIARWETMLRGNAAAMTFDLGRWDEAEQHLTALEAVRELDFPQINNSVYALLLAAERGDDQTTMREIDRLGEFVDGGLDPQMQGRYWAHRVSDLRWHGDTTQAYTVGSASLALLATDDDWMRAPRLAPLVVEAIADAVEMGVAEDSWIDAARASHERLTNVSIPTLFGEAFISTATADLSRAQGDNRPDLWRAAIDAWSDHPYYRAKARWRLAQSLTEADPSDPEIIVLLDQAQEAAEDLKARPLLDAIAAARENTPQ